jgi:hypothetical protein
MPKSIHNYWQYIDEVCPELIDPRLPVCKHMSWSSPGTTMTNYIGCEPDNYNSAIFDIKPHDMPWVRDQCFYYIDTTFKRKTIKGWMSLYVVTDSEKYQFNREILKLQPPAVWRYGNAKAIREKRTLIQRGAGYVTRNGTVNLTAEERLYQMGYYEKLKNKYFDDEIFLKVVGEPRGFVLNPEPEVLDCDGF